MRTLFNSLVIVALLLVATTAERVQAHARLEAANPGPDAVVPVAPAEVRIWFTQELTLRGHDIAVTDASGVRLDNADAQIDQTDPDRKQLFATLQPLPPGTYLVTYTARSAEDGHDYVDSYSFTVDPSAPPAAEPGYVEPAPVDPSYIEPAPGGSLTPSLRGGSDC